MLTILSSLRVGIQSWCFRGLQGNPDNIKALKECGIDGIEICGIHVNTADSRQVDEILKLYKDSGITITSLGIDRYPNDEEAVRPRFEFAKKAGIKVLGADPEFDAYELVERLCNEYGVKIAIHNHGRDHKYGYVKQLEEAFAKSSPNLGLCLDTAWALDAGEDPVNMIRKFSDRLYGIHFKDFQFDNNNKPIETILGTGRLDLRSVLDALKDVSFKGYATIEYEGEVENPVPSIKKCISEIKKL